MEKKTKKDDSGAKDRILNAAIDEFVEYGFYGARTQRIANRAKVNKALLHYYYSNKEKMYEQVMETVASYILEKLTDISEEPVLVEKKIEQIMDVYIALFTEYNNYLKIVLYEVMNGGDRLKNVIMAKSGGIRQNVKKFMKYFNSQVKAGKIRKINGIQLFISIVSQMAPLYMAKEMVGKLANVFGIDGLIVNKMVEERKKFVLDLIMKGIGRNS